MSNKLMTALWEHSTTKGMELFVLISLADNANDEGQCWPSVATIAHKVRANPRTVQRIIRALSQRGHLDIIDGGGRKSNRYLIHYPAPVVRESTHGNTPPLKEDTPGPQTTPPPAICHPRGDTAMSPEPKENPKEEPPLVVEDQKPEIKVEAERFALWFRQLLETTGAKTRPPEAQLAMWADTYEKLRRIDGREKEEIKRVCLWARNDPFWSVNFLTATKLRHRTSAGDPTLYERFCEKMNSTTIGHAPVRRASFA